MNNRLKEIDDKIKELMVLVMEDFSNEDCVLDLDKVRRYKSIENFGDMMVDISIKGGNKEYIRTKLNYLTKGET